MLYHLKLCYDNAVKIKYMNMKNLIYVLLGLALCASCREDELVILSDTQDTGATPVIGKIVGMYVLCEGNMGANKASVDYLDLSGQTATVKYNRNIYPERNPSEVKELGDVGNDIKVNGGQLWMLINCSNMVVVATADSCRKIAKIDIPNCRYVTFNGAYAYVSSYVGPVEVGGTAHLGRIYKVDTASFAKVDSVTVGFQPEEMAILDGKLYVANSGGYLLDMSERTVSVVDLATFTQTGKVEVAPNLHHLKADRYGRLWATSRGDYWSEQSKLYLLSRGNGGEMAVADTFDIPVSDFCIVGDSLYYVGVQWSFETNSNKISHGIVNVNTCEQVSTSLTSALEFSDIVLPYGIIVNPLDRDFYVMDAKDYLSSGQLYHFHADGSFDWRVWTGDIPGHAAFVYRKDVVVDKADDM